MGYYMGDYSYPNGGYTRGDPGFFSTIGKVFRGVGSVAASFIPGIGAPVSKVLSHVPPMPGGSKVGAIVKTVGGAIVKHPVLSGAGAAGVIGATGAAIGAHMGRAGLAPRGFHVNKHGKVVKNRRMRVTNPRALRRAIRRAHGFARLARRVMSFTSPHRPKGRGYFKTRKRKKM